jgi:hypothetical protein
LRLQLQSFENKVLRKQVGLKDGEVVSLRQVYYITRLSYFHFTQLTRPYSTFRSANLGAFAGLEILLEKECIENFGLEILKISA